MRDNCEKQLPSFLTDKTSVCTFAHEGVSFSRKEYFFSFLSMMVFVFGLFLLNSCVDWIYGPSSEIEVSCRD